MTEPPEHVGWQRDAQDAEEAEEAALDSEHPELAPPPEAMRRSLPLGRFLLLLVGACLAFALLIYFSLH